MALTGWLMAGGAVVALAGWYAARRRSVVPCTIDLEMTHDHFHAHVDLKGVEVDPGDEVLVHNAPNRLAYGEKRVFESTATVQKASWLRRQLTKLTGGTEITDLYEVGFEG
jgi:hypothetical protein